MAQLPEHPIGSTVRTDDDGSYVAYHRVCRNCQIELTSRNRGSGGVLKCKTCQASDLKASRREATGWPNQMGRPRKPKPDGTIDDKPVKRVSVDSVSKAEKLMESHHTVSPERQRIHALLTKFLLYPTLKSMKDDLLAGLVDYEIKERFRFL